MPLLIFIRQSIKRNFKEIPKIFHFQKTPPPGTSSYWAYSSNAQNKGGMKIKWLIIMTSRMGPAYSSDLFKVREKKGRLKNLKRTL